MSFFIQRDTDVNVKRQTHNGGFVPEGEPAFLCFTFYVPRSTFYVLRSTFYVPRSTFYVLRFTFVPIVQIILQDDRGGGGVEFRLPAAPIAITLRQPALRLAAGQTFIHLRDRE